MFLTHLFCVQIFDFIRTSFFSPHYRWILWPASCWPWLLPSGSVSTSVPAGPPPCSGTLWPPSSASLCSSSVSDGEVPVVCYCCYVPVICLFLLLYLSLSRSDHRFSAVMFWGEEKWNHFSRICTCLNVCEGINRWSQRSYVVFVVSRPRFESKNTKTIHHVRDVPPTHFLYESMTQSFTFECRCPFSHSLCFPAGTRLTSWFWWLCVSW